MKELNRFEEDCVRYEKGRMLLVKVKDGRKSGSFKVEYTPEGLHNLCFPFLLFLFSFFL